MPAKKSEKTKLVVKTRSRKEKVPPKKRVEDTDSDPQGPSSPSSEDHDEGASHKSQEKTTKEKTSEKKTTEETTTADKTTDKVRKRRNFGTILREEDEIEMGEWLRRNPCLYQKSMKEYKDITKKNTLWADKAAELHVESGVMLKTWYESIRTKVGKLNDGNSGSAAKSRTDRDNFILAHFGFLQTHICRLKGRTAVSLKPSQPPFPVESSGSEMEVEDDLEPIVSQKSRDRNGLPVTQSSATQPSTNQSSAGLAGRGKVKMVSKRKVSQRSDDDEDGIMAQLKTQQHQATKIQGEIQSILNREQQSATAAWGAWVGAMANQVDPKVHPGCTVNP